MKKQYTRKQIQEAISYWKKQLAKGNYRKVNESAAAGNGPKTFNVTILRDQTCALEVRASDEDEAVSVAKEIVDSGRLYDYIDESQWYSNPVEVGDVEEA